MPNSGLSVGATPLDTAPGADDPMTSLTLSLPGYSSKLISPEAPRDGSPFSEEFMMTVRAAIKKEVRNYMAGLERCGGSGLHSQEATSREIASAVNGRMGHHHHLTDGSNPIGLG